MVDLSQVGHGCPDLLAATAGTVVLLEVKSSEREKLTLAERAFFASWPGAIYRVVDEEDALRAVFGTACP